MGGEGVAYTGVEGESKSVHSSLLYLLYPKPLLRGLG